MVSVSQDFIKRQIRKDIIQVMQTIKIIVKFNRECLAKENASWVIKRQDKTLAMALEEIETTENLVECVATEDQIVSGYERLCRLLRNIDPWLTFKVAEMGTLLACYFGMLERAEQMVGVISQYIEKYIFYEWLLKSKLAEDLSEEWLDVYVKWEDQCRRRIRKKAQINSIRNVISNFYHSLLFANQESSQFCLAYLIILLMIGCLYLGQVFSPLAAVVWLSLFILLMMINWIVDLISSWWQLEKKYK